MKATDPAHPDDVTIAQQLIVVGVSALGDGGAALVDPSIRSTHPGAAVAGRAVTVTAAPGDNLAVQVAVAEAVPGSVVVVDATSAPAHGYWGEVLAVGAIARGVAGLVIDGGVRDVESYRQLEFPVFSTQVTARSTTKVGGGHIGGRARIGGTDVQPGDWVIGDDDGVAVITPDDLADVLGAAVEKCAKEVGWFERLRAGETTLDLYSLDPGLVGRRP